MKATTDEAEAPNMSILAKLGADPGARMTTWATAQVVKVSEFGESAIEYS